MSCPIVGGRVYGNYVEYVIKYPRGTVLLDRRVGGTKCRFTCCDNGNYAKYGSYFFAYPRPLKLRMRRVGGVTGSSVTGVVGTGMTTGGKKG